MRVFKDCERFDEDMESKQEKLKQMQAYMRKL